VIYFDNAATAGWRDEAVIEAMVRALREVSANPGRSLSLEAARVVEEARSEVAALFGVPDPAHVVFTKNATEALNLALLGRLREDDSVLVSSWEHNAVMRPLRWLERSRSVRVEFIPPASDSPVDLDWLEKRLAAGRVAMVAVLAASNVTGEVTPLAQIGTLCRERQAWFLADAAQGGGVLDIDLARDGIDALALTGHKSLGGPPGTGALCMRDPDEVEPLVRGGTGSRSEEEEQPGFAPDRFEAGTANVPGLAGLAAAVRLLGEQGLAAVRARHAELLARLLERLGGISGVELFGPSDPERQLATLSFRLKGRRVNEVGRALGGRGIYCRPGLHCAPRAHRTLGTWPEGTVRFSLASWNTEEEIDEAAAALAEIARSP